MQEVKKVLIIAVVGSLIVAFMVIWGIVWLISNIIKFA